MDLHNLKYSPEHLWVRLEDDNTAIIGLTEEAIEDFETITKLRLPAEGDEFSKDESFGSLSAGPGLGLRLLMPISGEILAINEEIVDTPEAILEDPYEECWLINIKVNFMAEYDDLMTREEYDDFISEEYEDFEDIKDIEDLDDEYSSEYDEDEDFNYDNEYDEDYLFDDDEQFK